MKYTQKYTKQGIISYIILIIAALILIAYFRNEIQAIFGSARFKDAVLTTISWVQTALIWVTDKLGWTSSQLK